MTQFGKLSYCSQTISPETMTQFEELSHCSQILSVAYMTHIEEPLIVVKNDKLRQ